MKRSEIEVPFESLATGNVGQAIMNQGKRGQGDFVRSETLPQKCNGCNRSQLEAMGIQFHDNADDLFVYVTLPNGWKKEATDHSMWSRLVDDKGRERASMFYKAAFYDRSAHIGISRRYNYGLDYDSPEAAKTSSVRSNGIVWQSEPVDLSELDRDAQWKGHDALENQAKQWLDEHYPDWKNQLAYWD